MWKKDRTACKYSSCLKNMGKDFLGAFYWDHKGCRLATLPMNCQSTDLFESCEFINATFYCKMQSPLFQVRLAFPESTNRLLPLYLRASKLLSSIQVTAPSPWHTTNANYPQVTKCVFSWRTLKNRLFLLRTVSLFCYLLSFRLAKLRPC